MTSNRLCTGSLLIGLLLALQGCGVGARKVPASPASASFANEVRGRLLYETACIACHTTQAHWRDKRIVQSWPELLYQVTRWQHNAGQNWSGAEIVDVGAYLNHRFYNLPCTLAGCGGPQEISKAGQETDLS